MESDNDILLKAVEVYKPRAKSQRELLKILIKVMDENDIASIEMEYLMEKLDLGKLAVYTILKNLQNEDIILKIRLKNTVRDSYQLNRNSLERILKTYSKKQA